MKALKNLIIVVIIAGGAYWLYSTFLSQETRTDNGGMVLPAADAKARLAEISALCTDGVASDAVTGAWNGWAEVDFEDKRYTVPYLEAGGTIDPRYSWGDDLFVAAYSSDSPSDSDGTLIFKLCKGGQLIVGHDYRKSDGGFAYGVPFRLEKAGATP